MIFPFLLLLGNLLLQSVDIEHFSRNEMDSKKFGKGSFAFAWVLDETEEERTR